jgi:hypothetical protein
MKSVTLPDQGIPIITFVAFSGARPCGSERTYLQFPKPGKALQGLLCQIAGPAKISGQVFVFG